MATASNIEWTQATWNCLVGCSKVSAGCMFCYAMVMAARIANAAQALLRAGKTLTDSQAAYRQVVKWERGGNDPADLNDKALPKWNGRVVPIPSLLDVPLRRKKPTTYFVNSMSDLFHEDVPDEFIDRVFAVMALTPQHTYQVLTKRPERMATYLTGHADGGRHIWKAAQEIEMPGGRDKPATRWPLPHVWLGISAEDQPRLDERLPWLLKTPAAVRFISAEPLLGPLNFARAWGNAIRQPRAVAVPIDWIIDGCESGPNRREFRIEWSRSIQAQCAAAGVAYFRKQIIINGRVSKDIDAWPTDLRIRQYPESPA